MAQYNEYQPAGAIPAQQPEEPDDTADPTTWDWSPVAVRDNLKRGNLERNCNDRFWAYALIIVVCSVIGFAVYGGLKADWSISDHKVVSHEASHEKIPVDGRKGRKLPASPRRVRTQDGPVTPVTEDGPKSKKSSMKGVVSKVLLNILFAGTFGMVFAYAWSHLLKRFAGSMIKMSIFIFIGLCVAQLVYMAVIGQWIIAIILAVCCALHALWFWCVRHRIPMAEATLSIAVGRLHKYWTVTWLSLGFSVLNIVWFVAMGLASFGVYRFAGLIDENDNGSFLSVLDLLGDESRMDKPWTEWAYHFVIQFTLIVVLFWGSIVISYIVHAICAGIMGTWYFGTSRKRTVTDALVRACTTSLGSISFASFILAVIRAMEWIAAQNERKAQEDGNMVACLIACCIRCILAAIGDIISYLNSLAIIRVAVYGEPFCVAAKRTMNMMKYRGMHQLINDDLSGMPVWLGCFICCLCCVPVMFGSYKLFPWLVIAHNVGGTSLWGMAFVASLVALFIPMCVLGTISSFTQALYVLWGDDPLALDQEHPAEAKLLKSAAFSHYNY